MVLRTLVTNYLREQAQSKLYETARSSLASQPGEQAEPSPPPPCEIAVIFGLGVEAGGLIDALENAVTTRYATFVEHTGLLRGRQLVVVEAGIGQPAAAAATAEVIALHQVRWVISAGFATALDGSLRRGHIVMAEEVADLHGHHIRVEVHVQRESLVGNPGLHLGRILTVEHVLRTAEEKHRLGSNHAALCADMETLGVLEACQQRHVPCLSVRLITDAADDELPHEIERMLDQKSLAGKLGAAAGAIWKHPGTIKEMWQLKEEAIKASDRLAKFLCGVVENLPRSAEL